jgi:hypothetical protein
MKKGRMRQGQKKNKKNFDIVIHINLEMIGVEKLEIGRGLNLKRINGSTLSISKVHRKVSEQCFYG